MITYFWHLIFYKPLYNGLILLLHVIPGGDVGFAVILFTLIVKFILFPLSKSQLETQKRMKELEPELAAIREKYKTDKQEQAKQTMQIYKDNELNPFSGILLLFIQIPIILALYQIFRSGLPVINLSDLYSFVSSNIPLHIKFLGLVDVSQKSWVLAILAGISQYFQAVYAFPAVPKKKDVEVVKKDTPPSFQDEFARGMGMQMRYILPLFITFIAFSVSGAVTLYWITNNIFTIFQELHVRKVVLKKKLKK